MNRLRVPALLLLLCLLPVACDDGENAPPPDGATTDLGSQQDGTAGDQGTSGDAAACDPASLAAEALSSGTKILGGVTLTTSTPIADILAGPSTYEGQTLRIEGWINEICQSAGCYVTLQDKQGNGLNLKVVDGTLDFNSNAKVGQYAVGEGVFSASGSHGAQVDIMQGGAMIGPTVCPI